MSVVNKDKILVTLNELNNLYNYAKASNLEAYSFSKVAVLELSGWVQETIEKITESYYSENIKDKTCNQSFGEIIHNNSGFHYDRNLGNILGYVIGIYGIKTIESKIGTGEISKLKALLTNLTKKRNDVAHNYKESSITVSVDAPSLTIKNCKDIFDLLKKLEKELKTFKII
jgi:hypothetical protein